MGTESKSDILFGQPEVELPKRFYKKVESVPLAQNIFQIVLDGNLLRTRGGGTLELPTSEIAEQIVKEWQSQEEFIDYDTMPFTRLCFKAIDHVADDRDSIIRHLAEYAKTDLICYFAEEPEELVQLQIKHWNKILSWTREKFSINLNTGTGIVYIAQSESDMARIKNVIGQFNNFALAAFHNMVSLTGSVFIPLSFVFGESDPQDCWSASRVDEDWQNSRWGVDDIARNDALRKRSEFDMACSFMLKLEQISISRNVE